MKRYLIYRALSNPAFSGFFFKTVAIEITRLAESSVGDLISHIRRDSGNDNLRIKELLNPPTVDELITEEEIENS